MNRLKNLSLSIAILFVLYIVVEALALELFFTFLPPIANPLLDDGVPVIIQHSKQSLIPHRYIALAGDSYAMGLGDDFYHQAGTAKAHYGSAPLIHQQTGKDVISFGSAGNGSIAGIVTKPLSTLAYWRAGWRIAIGDPEILLVYFYEGNDLNDNVEYLQHTRKKQKGITDAQLDDRSFFQSYIQEIALNQDSLYQQAQHLHWYDQLYLGKFVLRSSAALIAQVPHLLFTGKSIAPPSQRSPLNPPGRFEWTEPGSLNHAFINGSTVQLPDTLQGPSMDLTDNEKNSALFSFRESLYFLKQRLPHTKIAVIYIPSVISSYNIASTQVSVQSHARRKQFVFDTTATMRQSDWIEQHIQQISSEEQAAFIDARPIIRRAGNTQLLHGPLDWNHFNQAGYAALTEAVVSLLKTVNTTP